MKFILPPAKLVSKKGVKNYIKKRFNKLIMGMEMMIMME